MGNISAARELQRTGRQGQRWERKPHPLGQKPEGGEGKAPPGVGWGQANYDWGRQEEAQDGPHREEGRRPGLGILGTHEAGEGRLARSSEWALGQYEKGSKKVELNPGLENARCHTQGSGTGKEREGANYRCCSRWTRDQPPPPPPLVTCQCASYKAAAAAEAPWFVT